MYKSSSPQELTVKFATQPEYTRKIFDIIEELLDIVVLDKERRSEFIIGLGEALDNAITHGNKLNKEKSVYIECAVDKDKICCAVTDEGNGFKHEDYLAIPMEEFQPQMLIKKAARGKIGGLGIGLMRKCMDEVYFNESGNKITLVKYLAPATVNK